MEIEIFTDGSSKGNPGPGGYGIILRSGKHYKEISEGFRLTTNNRMELLAVIKGMEAIKKTGCQVTIWSDSKYVTDSIEKGWVFNWLKQDFKGKKNKDLWLRFLRIYPLHKVKFKWIKGHNNHPENEYCDKLATEAAGSGSLKIDEGFERPGL